MNTSAYPLPHSNHFLGLRRNEDYLWAMTGLCSDDFLSFNYSVLCTFTLWISYIHDFNPVFTLVLRLIECGIGAAEQQSRLQRQLRHQARYAEAHGHFQNFILMTACQLPYSIPDLFRQG